MSFEYQVGGSLRADAPSYVYRRADHLFYDALRAGQFCYVLNARQMGKSSLRVQVMRRLQREGVACIFIDLTGMGRQDLTPEKWYAGFVQALVTGGQLGQYPWRAWWRDRRELLPPCQRLGVFIEEVLCPTIGKPLVIFVDEIDRVLSQSFCLDDFFGLIRFFTEKKTDEPQRYPLTFALLGVASPGELIQDRSKSPFNIGKAIPLSGFQWQEATPLLQGLVGVDQPEQMLRDILDWTGGQPFLTQKLCQFIAESAQEQKAVVVEAVVVEAVVRSRILDHWESQDEPEHLRTIRDRILRNAQVTVQCLDLYRQVLVQGSLFADQSQAQQNLKLSGLVTEHLGTLKAHNRIYSTLFDVTWVCDQLAAIRPYADLLSAWDAAGQPTDQHLLTGTQLEAALQWSADKQLSDRDYQYLVASQQQAKQSVQQTLDVTQTANDLLRTAQTNAKTQAARYRCAWPWIICAASGVACAVMGLKGLGGLQRLELSLYDAAMRWNPHIDRDERIVLVTIDEADIQTWGRWPIADQPIATALTILNGQGVHSIGLDIYRDIPNEPGHSALIRQFQSTSNIFGIQKLVGQKIPAPAPLPRQQVGFADLVIDPDGVLRRALLSVVDQGELSLSLATQIALDYLKQKNITLQDSEADGSRVKLGQATFDRFDSHDGGYHRADDGGYQILLNWRQVTFDTLSLRQVLNQESPPGGWRDRIVLVGVTSEAVKDVFYTPLSASPFQPPKQMPGVEVHAQIVSLLIGSALGERSPLYPCSQIIGWLWTIAWAVLGAITGGRVVRLSRQLFGTGVALVGLGGSFLLIFWAGTWLTGAAGGLAFLGAQWCVLGLTTKKRASYQHQWIATHLQAETEQSPHAARLALKLWRNSESSN